jgi:gluconate 2-dehydrogenase gamma chain
MTGSSNEIDRREALRRTALLLGGTLSATTIAGVLAGVESPGEAFAAGVTPRVLTPEQAQLVVTVAEHIIPTTDTPGARAADVRGFIDTMLAEYYTADERERFVAGLADLDARARAASGTAFLRSTSAQQRAVLEALDREAFPKSVSGAAADSGNETERGTAAAPPANVMRADTLRRAAGSQATPFFRTFKEMTVVGYYTSQIGATRELKYSRVPGRFEGCVPFKTIGRAWSV